MLSYAFVTASCPPLRDGIESTSKSILVVPLHALPSLADPREAHVSRASSPYRLPEHGRSILARRVICRRPFCVNCLKPLRRRADDLQDRLLAVHRRGGLSSSERQRPALAWRSRSAGIAMSHRRQQTEARREFVTGDLEPAPKRLGGTVLQGARQSARHLRPRLLNRTDP